MVSTGIRALSVRRMSVSLARTLVRLCRMSWICTTISRRLRIPRMAKLRWVCYRLFHRAFLIWSFWSSLPAADRVQAAQGRGQYLWSVSQGCHRLFAGSGQLVLCPWSARMWQGRWVQTIFKFNSICKFPSCCLSFPFPVSVSLSLSVSVGATRARFRHSSPFCSGHHFVFFLFFSLASELLSQNDKIALELAHSPMHFLFAYLSLCLPPSRYPAIQFFPASLSRSLSLLLASHTRKPLDNFLFFFSVYLL